MDREHKNISGKEEKSIEIEEEKAEKRKKTAKGIAIASVCALVATGVSVIISIALKKKDIPVQKYSREWIEKLSDSEFDIEREIVRQNYCNSTLENYYKWESLLYLFDKIKVEKAPKIDRPYREPVHREHGFSLYKPD